MRNAAYEQLAVDDAKRREEMAVMSAKVAIVIAPLRPPPPLGKLWHVAQVAIVRCRR